MGNQLCCEANTTPPSFQNFQVPYSQKIIQFWKVNPTIARIIKQEKKLSKHSDEDYYQTIMKQLKPQNIKQFALAEGVFIGDAKASRYEKNGFGILLSHDGSYYEGEWKDNMRYGKGQYVDNQGQFYEGQWEKDEPSGEGIFKSVNPQVHYKGQWFQGMKNGKGFQQYNDGSSYSGQFLNGKKNGLGKIQYADGTYYEGQFIDNMIDGEGTFVGKTHKYKGSWKKGKMHGAGKSQWINDQGCVTSSYIGEYFNGMKQGFGQYTDSKGITYKANWIGGQIFEKGPIVVEKSSEKIQF